MAVIETSKLIISSSESKIFTNLSDVDKQIRQIELKCNGSGNIFVTDIGILTINEHKFVFKLRF